MNQKYTYYLRYACISGALATALALGGCSLGESGVAVQNEAQAASEGADRQAVSDGTDETIAPLGLDGQVLPGLDDVELPEDVKANLLPDDQYTVLVEAFYNKPNHPPLPVYIIKNETV